jgi:four helix bundle protein
VVVKSYGDLIVWQKAMDLVERIYRVSQGFPREELYGLTNQLRRAVVSIPSNIAEGQGRSTTRDFLRYLAMARGSLMEVETQVWIAGRLQYVATPELEEILILTSEIGKMLTGLIRTLSDRLQREDL